jgi:hypothetical protein
MKKTIKLKSPVIKSAVGILLMALTMQARADKTCSSAKCSVPNNCDCSTYQEQVINDPLNGLPVTHTGVVITAPSQSNCNQEPVPVSFSQSFTDQHTVGGSVTLGYSTSAQVQASILGAATATAGCSASVSGTGSISGSASETTTISAGPITLSHGQGVTWTVTGDYKTGDFSTAARVKGYYYTTDDPYGPIHTVTCQEATGSASGQNQYYNINGALGATYAVNCN